jgi:hypothetical protein
MLVAHRTALILSRASHQMAGGSHDYLMLSVQTVLHQGRYLILEVAQTLWDFRVVHVRALSRRQDNLTEHERAANLKRNKRKQRLHGRLINVGTMRACFRQTLF